MGVSGRLEVSKRTTVEWLQLSVIAGRVKWTLMFSHPTPLVRRAAVEQQADAVFWK
jgi:hypothetical protein